MRNDWLFRTNCSLPDYVEEVQNHNLLDGLYILMAAKAYNGHLAIVHGEGMWTTCASGVTEPGDSLIVASLWAMPGHAYADTFVSYKRQMCLHRHGLA